jgi:hypothetical protein
VLLPTLRRTARKTLDWWNLPGSLKEEIRRDHEGLVASDPGPQRVIDAALTWLGRAQDHSASKDGGVARHYSWVNGWSASYPETTGYIVPTLLEQGARRNDPSLIERGRRMLDWLVSLQFPEGGFQGGVVGQIPVVPVTFNTGQILIGLAAGMRVFGDSYQEPTRKAAQWLVDTLDADGCWRKHPTPFAEPSEKTYETHVSWGLLEAARVEKKQEYADAALRNMRWAISHQQRNGWFAYCCLNAPDRPLTHTIGYVLRGIVEGYFYSRQSWLLDSALKTADALLACQRPDGSLPGRLDRNWQPAANYVCLTGLTQIAACWTLLSDETGRQDYLAAALRANKYVRRTVRVEGPPDLVGGVKGSFPVDGEYGRYQVLNWAVKFFIDSNQLELDRRVV